MALCLVVFLQSNALADEAVRETLKVIRDTQKAHLSRYPEGIIEARCIDRSEPDDAENRADIHLEWKGDLAYWKYSYASNRLNGDLKQEGSEDCEYVQTQNQILSHDPTHKYLSISPVGRFGLKDQMMDVRPAACWYQILPGLIQRTWYEQFASAVELDNPGEMTLSDKGEATFVALQGDIRSEVTVDLEHGANVTRFYLSPAATNGSFGILATYEWVDDTQGGFRLKRSVSSQFAKTPDHPGRRIEIQILSFNPKPQFAKNRFTQESLKTAAGTTIEHFDAVPGSKPRVSKAGRSQRPRLSKEQLEKLADGLKHNGFSLPTRNEGSQP